jgi:hypothetical protein
MVAFTSMPFNNTIDYSPLRVLPVSRAAKLKPEWRNNSALRSMSGSLEIIRLAHSYCQRTYQ